jgi:threonine dehydrogenase-like Zn-dependent dehydrogenase
VSIEASGAYTALNEAIRATASGSKVVALGFYQGEARGVFLGEEMHHNRISVISSQIGSVGAELQHRWTRLRLVHTFMRLAAERKIRLHPLITHVAPAAEAPELFRRLHESPDEILQAVLDFS